MQEGMPLIQCEHRKHSYTFRDLAQEKATWHQCMPLAPSAMLQLHYR